MLRSLFLLLIMAMAIPAFAENYLIHIPKKYRQYNIRSSCVHASVTNCLGTVGLYDLADRFWDEYKGDMNGENSYSISEKLRRFNISHAMVSDEKSLINSLKYGRGAAVTFGGTHCVNLVGLIDGDAYLIDNESTREYIILPWDKFMRNFRNSGGWAVIVLVGKPPKPVYEDSLQDFED